MSQRFPEIRERVHSHPTDFTGHAFRGDSSFNDDDFDWAAWAELEAEREKEQVRWAKHMPEQEPDRAVATNACAFLFPGRAGKHEGSPEDELHIADPDRLARYFRMMSLESVPEAGDIHRMLSQPPLLTESLATGTHSELVFLLQWIHNYLPSCTSPDVTGCTEIIVDRAILAETASELTRELVSVLNMVLTRLIKLADKDIKTEPFLLVINKAPLSISEELLLEAAAEQGKWPVRPEMKKPLEQQLVPDDSVVNNAIAIWSTHVRNRVEAETLLNETRMHAILYRFAQLNLAYSETYKMVEKICSTEKGLRRFLAIYEEDSPFNTLDNFTLVENSEMLANRINETSLKDEYAWLVTQISSEENAKAIQAQSTRLKGI